MEINSNKIWRKHYLGPYILGSQSIWSIHFGSNQFDPCYFQSTINLVLNVNFLTENAYVANGLPSWQIKAYVVNKILIKKFKLTFKNVT